MTSRPGGCDEPILVGDGIVSFFLCQKWYRSRQQSDAKQQLFNAAVRNQTQAQTSPHRGFSPPKAEFSDSQERLQRSLEAEALYGLMWDVDEIDYPELTMRVECGKVEWAPRKVAQLLLTLFQGLFLHNEPGRKEKRSSCSENLGVQWWYSS